PRAASTASSAANPADCEITETARVGSRRETSPPAKSAIPHVADDASASRMATTGIERASLPFAPMEPLRIGVLAVQGNFREHAAMLGRLGANVVEVRKPDQLTGLDGLVIPGGESTTFM